MTTVYEIVVIPTGLTDEKTQELDKLAVMHVLGRWIVERDEPLRTPWEQALRRNMFTTECMYVVARSEHPDPRSAFVCSLKVSENLDALRELYELCMADDDAEEECAILTAYDEENNPVTVSVNRFRPEHIIRSVNV